MRWSASVQARPKMLLSWQTYVGLKISSYSLIEATKFLLNHGFDFVLTERLCQDIIEEYLGQQYALGRWNNNPHLHQFGYNDNTIRTVQDVTVVMGNTRAAQKQKCKPSWYIVDNRNLKKKFNIRIISLVCSLREKFVFHSLKCIDKTSASLKPYWLFLLVC